jgi:ubiquinone/menaquinone biosynthesis C-methylase UbiE
MLFFQKSILIRELPAGHLFTPMAGSSLQSITASIPSGNRMKSDIEKVKLKEKKYHEQFREGGELPAVDVDEVRRTCLAPCYTTGSDRYSDNKMAFHRFIKERDSWENKYVLDYACGDGAWAAYFALTGARKVAGFDIGETGIRRGQKRIDKQGLNGKARLYPMDASKLKFHDNEFEMVIGHAVIHHVIKYPNVFEELHRVMKPGSKAFFLENLADFPFWKLHWKIKGEIPEGDVPIFSKEIRQKTRMFSAIEIKGDSFLFSLKHFLWKAEMGFLRKQGLRTLKLTDEILFASCPPLRHWGGFCYICLTK